MDARQLETFRIVARELNFTRAAEQLGYAQSSVTAQIQALEAEVGEPLFERLGKRVMLTQAGAHLLDYAVRIGELFEEAKHAVRASGEPEGRLRLGVSESICTYRLPPLFHYFHDHYPKVRLEVHAAENPAIRAGLGGGELDVAVFIDEPWSQVELEVVTLVRETLAVVARPDHPLVGRRRVNGRELARVPLIVNEGRGYGRLLEDFLRRSGAKPELAMQFNSIEAIKQCVAAGIGISILPQVAVADEIARGVLAELAVPIASPYVTQLAYHRRKAMSPALRAFIDGARRIVAIPAAPAAAT